MLARVMVLGHDTSSDGALQICEVLSIISNRFGADKICDGQLVGCIGV